ncbi:MAG: HAMP domain-containing histidine kinase [Lachnospiraceae bacterium]|nr:HAMP domain-containing histidine kinase [Lachnospiraceae bacterium]
MKNKIELKKYIIGVLILTGIFCTFAGVLHYFEYVSYQRAYNEALAGILVHLKEKYPDVSEGELMQILNGTVESLGHEESAYEAEHMLSSYGIDLQKDAVVKKNQMLSIGFFFGWILFVMLAAGGICHLFLRYNKKKDREIAAITRYIEEINRKNYTLKLDDMSEDELSMLKTEIYKTTIMLKEAAENSKKDKENLKDALADISHQMKTPLTSILVVLDNLIDDPDMDPAVRQDFILVVKREIGHIQFLVQALLKMTKLDAGTVSFIREEVPLKDICEEAVRNVDVLCDLKNVEIKRNYCNDYTEVPAPWVQSGENRGEKLSVQKKDGKAENDRIFCDLHWQTEAVTNILKNCVEHAPEGSSVWIETEKNQVYGSIRITDFGPGIEEEDQKHLFERFYRGKNASKDGVGIGLSLAKSIVEQDEGRIFVESSSEKTVFEMKYFI